MGKTTRLLLLGLGLGALTLLVGFGLSRREDAALEALVEKCRAGETHGAKAGADSSAKPQFDFKLICEPEELRALGSADTVGVQREIALAADNRGRTLEFSVRAAAAVFGLLSLPWFWYFLLDRLRELATAIKGERK